MRRSVPPSSLFESAGQHVCNGKVYYLNAVPGKARDDGADDSAHFELLGGELAKESHVV